MKSKKKSKKRSRKLNNSPFFAIDINNISYVPTNKKITLDFEKFRKFFKISKHALDQKTAKSVIEIILNKYKHKMNKCSYEMLNDIVANEYAKAGYRGNLANDKIWVRDAVIPFLLDPKLNDDDGHTGKWKVVYKLVDY